MIKSNIATAILLKEKQFQVSSIYFSFFSNHLVMISHQFVLKMLFGLGFFEKLTTDLGCTVFFTTDFGY